MLLLQKIDHVLLRSIDKIDFRRLKQGGFDRCGGRTGHGKLLGSRDGQQKFRIMLGQFPLAIDFFNRTVLPLIPTDSASTRNAPMLSVHSRACESTVTVTTLIAITVAKP